MYSSRVFLSIFQASPFSHDSDAQEEEEEREEEYDDFLPDTMMMMMMMSNSVHQSLTAIGVARSETGPSKVGGKGVCHKYGSSYHAYSPNEGMRKMMYCTAR